MKTAFLILGLLITQFGVSQNESFPTLKQTFTQNTKDGLLIFQNLYPDSIGSRVDTIILNNGSNTFSIKSFGPGYKLIGEGRFHIHGTIDTSRDDLRKYFEKIIELKKENQICLLEHITFDDNEKSSGHMFKLCHYDFYQLKIEPNNFGTIKSDELRRMPRRW